MTTRIHHAGINKIVKFLLTIIKINEYNYPGSGMKNKEIIILMRVSVNDTVGR